MPRKSSKVKTENRISKNTQTYLEKISSEVSSNQSRLSMILGGLIVLVSLILLFNYFNKSSKESLGPSQKTEITQQSEDTKVENLPGNYTVKEGDTLFIIAQKYYSDGYKYSEIVKANNILNPDLVEVGQVLNIPKIDSTPSIQAIVTPTEQTPWGEKITGDKYTVTEGDWLSTISARAYGDVYSFDKIVKANNIQNPDLIEPGTVLTIPR